MSSSDSPRRSHNQDRQSSSSSGSGRSNNQDWSGQSSSSSGSGQSNNSSGSGRSNNQDRSGQATGGQGQSDRRNSSSQSGRSNNQSRQRRSDSQGASGRSGNSQGRPDGPRKRDVSGIDQARRTAYDVLHEVGSQGAYTHVALGQHTRELDARDAAFATDLVYGTTRHQLTLDTIVELASGRELAVLDPRVVDVLRLGAYQLLFAEVDTYAAVDTSVNLVKSVCGPAPAGLINAVLRKVAARDLAAWLEQIDRKYSGQQALARRTSHPEWMISALADALGQANRDQIEALLRADNEPARPTLVARPGMSDVQDLIDQGSAPGRYSPYAATAAAGSLRTITGLRNGSVAVQDEGSQLVALALTNAEVDGKEHTWVDLCAGPGGKLGLLSAIAGQRGIATVGVELHPHRAKLVDNSARRIPGYAGVVVGDGRAAPIKPGVDRVLLDVPCTGIGVLRRRPEIRWRRTPSDVSALATLQRELLTSAVNLLRPGGVVAYTTCSPHIAETSMIISRFLKKNDNVALEDARGLFPDVDHLGDGPYVRLWPHLHGTDGMFFALLRRAH